METMTTSQYLFVLVSVTKDNISFGTEYLLSFNHFCIIFVYFVYFAFINKVITFYQKSLVDRIQNFKNLSIYFLDLCFKS
jgi:hypothetical protein